MSSPYAGLYRSALQLACSRLSACGADSLAVSCLCPAYNLTRSGQPFWLAAAMTCDPHPAFFRCRAGQRGSQAAGSCPCSLRVVPAGGASAICQAEAAYMWQRCWRGRVCSWGSPEGQGTGRAGECCCGVQRVRGQGRPVGLCSQGQYFCACRCAAERCDNVVHCCCAGRCAALNQHKTGVAACVGLQCASRRLQGPAWVFTVKGSSLAWAGALREGAILPRNTALGGLQPGAVMCAALGSCLIC